MNFKASALKIISSIIVGIISGIWTTNEARYLIMVPDSDFLGPILVGFFSLLSAVVTYVIWSLIQKKE